MTRIKVKSDIIVKDKEASTMKTIRWLLDCLAAVLSAFKNSLSEPEVIPRSKKREDFQEIERQAALRELDNLKNLPPDGMR